MNSNYDRALPLFLKHEGGFVNHPKDPGGATNKGVTIGTLKRLGIDVDGDGDSDITDLRNLRHQDVARVYKLFYWDAVKGDLLPSGLDYAMADFAINSGPARAAKHLQKVVGVAQDGDIGPKTLAAVAARDTAYVISALCDSRLRFLKALRTWGTFGKGWGRRVAEVRAVALAWADAPAPQIEAAPKAESPAPISFPPAASKPTQRGPSGPVAIVVLAVFGAIAAAATGAWNWLLGLFN
jgi:lysozyme family protein